MDASEDGRTESMGSVAPSMEGSGMALDLTKEGGRRRRIFIVRRKATPETNADPATAVVSSGVTNPSAPATVAGSLKAAHSSPGKSSRRGIVVAHIVKAGEIESVGPTSPVRNNEEKAGPKRDPRTGRVLERSILGSAADFEELENANKPAHLRRGVSISLSDSSRNLDAPASGLSAGSGRGTSASISPKQSLASIPMSTGVLEAGAGGDFDVYRARLESDEVKSSRRARILAARTAELADAEADAARCTRAI